MRAELARRRGDAPATLAAYTEATQLAAGDVRAWQGLGSAHVEREDPRPARENLRRLEDATDVAMIEPVPYGKVRGAGFYLQFLDNRDWAGFMRQGRVAGRQALARLGRTGRRGAGSRTSVGRRRA